MMIYWEYILIFAIFFYAARMTFRRLRKIRCDYFHKTALRNMLGRIGADRSNLYINSDVLRRAVIFLLGKKNKVARRALLNLLCGKTAPAVAYLRQQKKEFCAAVIETFTNPACHHRLEKIKTPEAEIELAVLYFGRGNLPRVKQIVEASPDSGLGDYSKARKRFCQSYLFVADGDMLSASQCAAESGKLFNRCGAYFEEAQSFLLAGTIYRLSCIEDVAKFMFDTAFSLFSQYRDDAGRADIFGNRGMLWVLQEKFIEAEDEFEKALQINRLLKRNHAETDILNQLALLKLLQKDYSAAEKLLEQSKEICKRHNNLRGQAFIAEVSAHVCYEQKQFGQAVIYAREAVKLYKNTENVSAYFESLYLQALAEFDDGKSAESEKLLRDLIAFSKKKKTSFHIAGAYTLMGLINLKQAKTKEAKVWFQEAAILEQKNDRYSGAATDYANMGLIELKCGNKEQALRNLETAISFAKIYGETELSELLYEKLEKLKV